MRVGLYARFSSDLQNERSAEDQLNAMRSVARARGWTVAGEYADLGVSGASIATRPQVKALMRDAANGRFDVVMTEALDRLSRGQADTARLFELLSFYGVRLETLSSGPVTALHIGLEGTMNSLFLAELGRKTRRGLIARVQAGYSGGGRCYGYAIVDKGVLRVDPAEAGVVQRIFTRYVGGESPRAIARALNAEGVPGPRGGEWTAASINGDRRSGDGILHNELYVGVRVFNRRRFRKNPETGRRSSVLNPPGEWVREDAPDLRIVDDGLWRAAQERKAALAAMPRALARAPKRLLSGLIRCGLCGGSMTLNAGRYTCSTRRERGTCSNARCVPAQAVEIRVIEGVRAHLLDPDVAGRAVRAYQAEHDRLHREAHAERGGLERELAEIDRRRDRIVMSIEDGTAEAADIKPRLAALRARRAEIEDALARAPEPAAFRICPGAADFYRRAVEHLHEALECPDGEEVRRAFRELIDHVDLRPTEVRGGFSLEVSGILAALLGENRAALCGSLGAGARSRRSAYFPIMRFAA